MQSLEIDATTLLRWQQEQFAHDQRNHTDIIGLSRVDKLKHYGLHYAKYAGRIARAGEDSTVTLKTMVDAALVCLSAANALSQRLDRVIETDSWPAKYRIGPLADIADAGGRFSDACEKIDHLEDFLSIAREANIDVLRWVWCVASEFGADLQTEITKRRQQLAERQFLIPQQAR